MTDITISDLRSRLARPGTKKVGLSIDGSALTISAADLLAALGGVEQQIFPDLSHWNADPTAYNTVPAVFMKATQGINVTSNVDSYRARALKFRGFGTLVGAYHYITKDDPEAQAKFFLDTLQPDEQTALAVDWEIDVDPVNVLAFCEAVYQRAGVRMLIYTRADIVPDNAPAEFAQYPLWLASQEGVPIPKPWTSFVFQQFAQGNLPGFPGTVDINRFIGSRAELTAYWSTLCPKPLKPRKFLDVPYISQEAPDARKYRNDCGVACVEMLLKWQAQQINVPVPVYNTDSLSAETSLSKSDDGLTSIELVTLANQHGLLLRVMNQTTQQTIKDQIDQGFPVIALLSYGAIQNRENKADFGGHFFVIRGYDDTFVYCNDPDFWTAGAYTAEMGNGLAVLWTDLLKGLATMAPQNQIIIVGALFKPTRMQVVYPQGVNWRQFGSVNAPKINEAGFAYKALVDVDLTRETSDSAGNFFAPVLYGGWVATHNVMTGTVFLATPKTSWQLPFSASARGGHADAGGWSPDAIDLDIARRNEIETLMIVAYMSDQADKTIPAYRNAGVKNFILRATIGEKITTPQRFVDLTVPCLKSYARLLGSDGLMIAISNEPNLATEGWGSAWADGAAFAAWWQTVATAYRAVFSGCKLGFPAMSPGGDIAGVRLSEQTFVIQAQKAVEAADWIGVHSYWQSADGSDYQPSIQMWHRQFGGNVPIVATEVGPTPGQVTAPAVLKAYKLLGDAGIPAMQWILNGRGSFANADWRINNIQLPHKVTVPPTAPLSGWGVQTLEGTYSEHLADNPIFKSVDGVGAVQQAHARNEKAVKVIRFYDADFDHPEQYVAAHGGVQPAVQAWVDKYWPQIQQIPYALVEGPCDGDPTPTALAVETERIKQLAARGVAQFGKPVKALVGNWHVTATSDDLWKRSDAQAFAAFAEQMGCPIGIHAYGEGIISSNCGGTAYWQADGSWGMPGTPLPSTIDLSQCFLALRVVRDMQVLGNLGLHPQFIATELGIDDCAGDIGPDGKSSNGIYRPHGIKTQGWRTCWGVWQAEGWTNSTITPAAFLKLQLDWWVRMTQCLGLVFAWNDHTNPPPGSDVGVFDVRDAL